MGISHFIFFPTSAILKPEIVNERYIMQVSKKCDSKGRLMLGAAFANAIFLVNEEDEKIVIKKAIIVPENEMWLHKNGAAMSSVQRGLKQAKQGKFGRDPLTDKKNMSWLDEVED